jgi:hypothetical protein
MHRRPLGRGRMLAVVAALVMLVGCFLPWWTFGGREGDLSSLSGNAFEGAGILVFLSALAVIALVALPYAEGDRPVGINRPLSFVVVAAVGWIGFLVRLFGLISVGTWSIPDRLPQLGIWVVLVGLVLLSRAVYDISREPAWR